MAAAKAAKIVEAVMSIDGVVATRGLGLLMAVELAEGIESAAVAVECLKQGLILNAVTPTALRLTPPIVIPEELIIEGAAILAAAIATVRGDG